MNRVQYAKYESGKNSPSVDVLAHLCRIHAVSADWLLGLSDLHASVPPHEVKAGANSAVAIGSNAQASVSFGEAPACSRCPYKKRLAKIEKMLGK